MKTKELTQAAMFVAVISIAAQIIIPLPYIPFSLQVFAIALSAYLLQPKQIILTLSVYLFLGFIGIPVFSGFSSGFMKPSIGFLFGFLPFALLLKKSKVLALLTLYVIGLSVLSLYFHFMLDIKKPLTEIILLYGLIFIPSDLLAITLAHKISKRRLI